jgi:hypothetical protein
LSGEILVNGGKKVLEIFSLSITHVGDSKILALERAIPVGDDHMLPPQVLVEGGYIDVQAIIDACYSRRSISISRKQVEPSFFRPSYCLITQIKVTNIPVLHAFCEHIVELPV